MPPTRATMKKWGWSDEKIALIMEEEKRLDNELEEYLRTHPNAKMLDILEVL